MHAPGRSVNKELVATYPAHTAHRSASRWRRARKWATSSWTPFLDRLTTLGVAGVHLGTNTDNTPSRGVLHERAGFTEQGQRRLGAAFAMRLPRAAGAWIRRDLTFHSTSCQERVTVATHRSASRRQQLAYVCFEDEPGRRSAAKLLSNLGLRRPLVVREVAIREAQSRDRATEAIVYWCALVRIPITFSMQEPMRLHRPHS